LRCSRARKPCLPSRWVNTGETGNVLIRLADPDLLSATENGLAAILPRQQCANVLPHCGLFLCSANSPETSSRIADSSFAAPTARKHAPGLRLLLLQRQRRETYQPGLKAQENGINQTERAEGPKQRHPRTAPPCHLCVARSTMASRTGEFGESALWQTGRCEKWPFRDGNARGSGWH